MAKSLPSTPSLEHLRKEAKAFLKAHKSKQSENCNVLRHLNRFKDMPNEDILDAKVSLAEVQFALSIEYGAKNWADLKAKVLERQGS